MLFMSRQSSVAGLLCFALSSTNENIFRRWGFRQRLGTRYRRSHECARSASCAWPGARRGAGRGRAGRARGSSWSLPGGADGASACRPGGGRARGRRGGGGDSRPRLRAGGGLGVRRGGERVGRARLAHAVHDARRGLRAVRRALGDRLCDRAGRRAWLSRETGGLRVDGGTPAWSRRPAGMKLTAQTAPSQVRPADLTPASRGAAAAVMRRAPRSRPSCRSTASCTCSWCSSRRTSSSPSSAGYVYQRRFGLYS